jgi:hypothetical protein
MSATPGTIEQLLRDLIALEDVHIGASSGGDGFFTLIYRGPHGPVNTFTMDWEALSNTVWIHLETEPAALFTRLAAIRTVRFDRRPDGHAPEKESLSVLVTGWNSDAHLSFHFGHLYEEQGQPIAAQFALWKELRARYGGHDELRVEDGRLIPVAT